MKNITILIFFSLVFINCSSSKKKGYPKSTHISINVISNLNKIIDKSQKESLLNSPFKESEYLKNYLDIQQPFREQYIQELQESSNDTIFLVESYDEICVNCRANHIAIYKNSILITYKKKLNKDRYEKEKESLALNFIDKDGYEHNDISELISEIRNNNVWYINPQKYGTDKVLGGSYTFYTVIYPNKKVESMYIRSWIPQYLRKQ